MGWADYCEGVIAEYMPGTVVPSMINDDNHKKDWKARCEMAFATTYFNRTGYTSDCLESLTVEAGPLSKLTYRVRATLVARLTNRY